MLEPRMLARDAFLFPAVGPQGKQGEQGPKGDPGDASNLQETFWGPYDPPDFIEGAKPGDVWVNTITGDTYELK